MEAKAELQGWTYLGQVCCGTALCCFWIPMIFFMGAANVLETCEAYLGEWMRVFGIIAVVLQPVMECLSISAAKAKCRIAFKLGNCLRILGGLAAIGNCVYGFLIHAATTDENCYGGEGIDPRLLTMVFCISNVVSIGLALCGLCCGILALKNNPEAAKAAWEAQQMQQMQQMQHMQN
jgi:hypothetical protein